MRIITDAEIAHFDDHGYVICSNVLAADELAVFDRETKRLIDEILAGGPARKWCFNGPEGVPFYLTYLHRHPNDTSLRLLAHPFVGDLLTRMVGADFIPCWESLVFKLPGNGSSVPWHRDDQTIDGNERIFNIDFYPDPSRVDNACVWVVPGSQKWEKGKIDEMIRRGRENFRLPGAVPAEVRPGDVLLHHTRVLHGSEVNKSGTMRRVIYFDNRSVSMNRKYKWFDAKVIEKRCLLYQYALHERKTRPFADDREGFAYKVPAGMPRWTPGSPIDLHCPRDPKDEQAPTIPAFEGASGT